MVDNTKISTININPYLNKFHITNTKSWKGSKFIKWFPIISPNTKSASVVIIVKANSIVLIYDIIDLFIKPLFLSCTLYALFTPLSTALKPEDAVYIVNNIETPNNPVLW